MNINLWSSFLKRGFLIAVSVIFVFDSPGYAQKPLREMAILPNLTNNPQSLPYNLYLPAISKTCSCYYIDSNNGSDSNSGTQPDKPWKSLSKLSTANLKPGAIVHLKRGSIWTEKLRLYASGQVGRPITITAYGSGAPPILSNPGGTENNESVLYLHGSFIIIDNLHIQESGTGISIFSDHNIIQNSEIDNIGIGLAISGQYNLITHNYIHDTHMVHNDPGGNDDWGAIGIDILNAHNEISFNRLVNCEAFSYDFGIDGGAIEIYQIGDYTSIHHNWSFQTAGFMEASSNGTGSAINVTISYNVILNATTFTTIHVSDEYATEIRDFRVENNTIVDLRAHDPLIGSYFSFGGTPLPDTYILRNNIIYISDYYWVSKSQFTHQNNLYYFLNPSTTLGFALGAGENIANPKFIDLTNDDFHLMSTSPARNAATNIGYTEDFDLNPVPIDNVPDLGAFEYQGN
jgi:hypothetical protein